MLLLCAGECLSHAYSEVTRTRRCCVDIYIISVTKYWWSHEPLRSNLYPDWANDQNKYSLPPPPSLSLPEIVHIITILLLYWKTMVKKIKYYTFYVKNDRCWCKGWKWWNPNIRIIQISKTGLVQWSWLSEFMDFFFMKLIVIFNLLQNKFILFIIMKIK